MKQKRMKRGDDTGYRSASGLAIRVGAMIVDEHGVKYHVNSFGMAIPATDADAPAVSLGDLTKSCAVTIELDVNDSCLSTRTCGHCALVRDFDGYCRQKGTYVNALNVEECFVAPEQPEQELQPETQTQSAQEEMRVCRQCGRLLPLSQYARHAMAKDGYQPICRECMAERVSAAKLGKPKRKAQPASAEGAVPEPEKPHLLSIDDLREFDDEDLFAELTRRGYKGEVSKIITL